MKRLLLALVFAMFLSTLDGCPELERSFAYAAGPYLVCDPAAGVDHYVITGLPSGMDGSNVLPDQTGTYGFKFDVSGTPKPSSNSLSVSACTTWGDCSTAVPFVLARPLPPTSPASIRLSK